MTDRQHKSGAPFRNFYGRIHGKTLNQAQKDYLDQDLDARAPGPVGWDVNPERVPLDLVARFGERPVWLEIGFGGGEHLVHLAGQHPEVGLIGCEPFVNGVAMLLGKLRQTPRENLAVHAGDARDLFDVLPAGSVERVYLLYPDPWPKKRHHRRRFVTPGYLAPLARVMAPGAELRVATDIPDYVRQTLAEVPPQGFDCLTALPDGMAEPWEDWLSTRYEQKALREGRRPHYLRFRRQG